MLNVAIKGYGHFRSGERRWNSHNAWAVFRQGKNDEKPRIVQGYGQKPQGGGEYVRPYFKRKELERMKERAAEAFTRMADAQPLAEQDGLQEVRECTETKPHPEELCERCENLGYSCKGVAVDVMGTAFQMRLRAHRARKKRLSAQGIRILYHQTSPEAANEILRTQTMKNGTQGMAGGGIYFAESPEDTKGKALRTGMILKCHVRLGKMKRIGARGDANLNFERLQNDPDGPFDSVYIPRTRPEYVVYMSDQVERIEPMRA